MPEQPQCACQGALRLVFACSGAADVGAIADQAARRLSRDGAAQMFCLAGIGGRIPGIVKTTEAAGQVLARSIPTEDGGTKLTDAQGLTVANLTAEQLAAAK